MKKDLLISNKYRKIGLIFLLPSIAMLIAVYSYNYSFSLLQTGIKYPDGFGVQKIDLSGTVAIILTLISLFFTAFSREKQEDEYVRAVRLKALQISVYINYGVLMLATIFIYGTSFLLVMEINLFTVLVLFIIIYYYQLYIKPMIFKSKAV